MKTFCSLSAPLLLLALLMPAPVLVADVLGNCRAKHAALDEVHDCLDGYLDLMDQNLSDLDAYISDQLSLDEQALAAFRRSQDAFESFRRENCLWYLAFSSPRTQAEQIAKNCLAEFSTRRLDELQALLASPGQTPPVAGYYVYGADRNTLQLCNARERYWVEGEMALVGQLQQDYLAKAAADLQIIYVELEGRVDADAGNPYPGHDGVFRMTDVRTIRVPTDRDCAMPVASNTPATVVPEAPSPVLTAPAAELPVPAAALPATPAPQAATGNESDAVGFRAYFGDWSADCVTADTLPDNNRRPGCALKVVANLRSVDGGLYPELTLNRREDGRTTVDLWLPGVAVADVADISWQVDDADLGPVLHARLQTSEQGVRQLLHERWFVRDELLPLLIDGRRLRLVVGSGDGEREQFDATLLGLTRALAFADDMLSTPTAAATVSDSTHATDK